MLDLARRLRLPVLLVLTYRPEFDAPWTGQPQVTALTLSRLGRREGAQIAQRGGQMPSERLLRRQVLERLIVKELQLQQASRIGIQVTDDELDRAIADIAARNKLTLEQLSARVEAEGGEEEARRRRPERRRAGLPAGRGRSCP